MNETIRGRLRRGLGGQAFSQAVNLAFQFGSVPLFLHFWDKALYGEWLILAAFPAYLVISNLGFTNATSYEVTMRVSRGDTAGALRAFQTSWLFVTLISLAVAGLAMLALWFAPLAAWFNLAELSDHGAAAVLALLLIQILFNIQTGLAAVGLMSAGQYGLQSYLTALTRLVSLVLIAGALMSGARPLGVAIVVACVEAAGFLVVFVFAHRHSPWLRYGFTHVSRETWRQLAPPSLGFVGLTVANAISIQGPIIVLGAILGPSAVAVFATLRMLARAVVLFANLAFTTVRPEIAMAYGRDDIDLVRRLNNRAVQFAAWLAMIAFVGLMVFGPAIVDFWTVGRIPAPRTLLGLLLIGGLSTMLWNGVATALYATNNNRAIATIYGIAAASGLAVLALVTPGLGINGAAASLAIAEVAVVLLVMGRTLAFLDQRFASLVLAALTPPTDALRLLRRGDGRP